MAQQISPLVKSTPSALQQGLGTIGLRNEAVSTIFRSDQMPTGPMRYCQLPSERRHYGATDLATMWDAWGHVERSALAALPD